MALVNIQNIQFQNNPCPFLSPLRIDVTFECLKPITDDIEWQLVYIGSANDEKYDQVLDKFSIGNLEQGVLQFTIETEAPDHTKIPSKDDLLGVTAIILTVSYKQQEFFRVGYYVYNQYTDPELIVNDPPQILIDKVERSILSNQPRITHFNIKWSAEDEAKTADPNTFAIIQQQLQQGGGLSQQVAAELNQVNAQMMQQMSDPFAKSNGILHELSSNYMFGNGIQVPSNQSFSSNNINSNAASLFGQNPF